MKIPQTWWCVLAIIFFYLTGCTRLRIYDELTAKKGDSLSRKNAQYEADFFFESRSRKDYLGILGLPVILDWKWPDRKLISYATFIFSQEKPNMFIDPWVCAQLKTDNNVFCPVNVAVSMTYGGSSKTVKLNKGETLNESYIYSQFGKLLNEKIIAFNKKFQNVQPFFLQNNKPVFSWFLNITLYYDLHFDQINSDIIFKIKDKIYFDKISIFSKNITLKKESFYETSFAGQLM